MTPRTLTKILVFAFAVTVGTNWSPVGHVRAASSKYKSLAIIVNLANPVDNLTMPELRAIFSGKRSHWVNGQSITLVMMEQGQRERETVLRQVCRLSESGFRRRFRQGAEGLVSPKTLASPEGVRKFVFNVPGAIGYVKVEDLDSSVKVVRIDGHLPGEAGYPLRTGEIMER